MCRWQRLFRVSRHDLYNINFRCASTLERMHAKVILPIASRNGLRVLQFAIARIVAPRPNVVGGRFVRGAAQIPQHPHGGPQSPNVRVARKNDINLDNPARETKLLPRLDHARREIRLFVLPRLFHVIEAIPRRLAQFGGDFEIALLGSHGRGVVKLQGPSACLTRIVVGFVERGPERIVAIFERAAVDIEFVRHDL